MSRHLSPLDRLLSHADQALRTIVPGAVQAERTTPAQDRHSPALEEAQRKHTAGLMRINHTGEVCAQALYQGQALTAHDPAVKSAMEQCAREEVDHLAWCEQRLRELNSHTSLLNPAFYAMSFGIGALAGLIGDKVSLGFVAATEDRVCAHLTAHLSQLNAEDDKSRAILQQMLEDEASHASQAMAAGGLEFPAPVKAVMVGMSKVMTGTTYYV